MIEQNERMAKFLEAIDRDAQERREKIEAEIDETIRKELVQAEEDAKAQGALVVRKETEKLRGVVNRRIAGEESLLHAALARKRMAITDAVFEKAAQRLRDFTATPAYPDFLAESAARIAKLFPEGNVKLLVREADLTQRALLTERFGRPCVVEADGSIEIGGCRAMQQEEGLLADDTLDSRLKAQRDWFLEHSGLSIQL